MNKKIFFLNVLVPCIVICNDEILNEHLLNIQNTGPYNQIQQVISEKYKLSKKLEEEQQLIDILLTDIAKLNKKLAIEKDNKKNALKAGFFSAIFLTTSVVVIYKLCQQLHKLYNR